MPLRSLGISTEMASKLLDRKISTEVMTFHQLLTGDRALTLKQSISLDETKFPKTVAALRKIGRLNAAEEG
jgi:hypothetical protein